MVEACLSSESEAQLRADVPGERKCSVQIFHSPRIELVRGLLKNSAGLFTNESRKNGNGTGLNGLPACFLFARFFRDDSLMEDSVRSALLASKTLVPPESKHPNEHSELQ